MKVLAGQRENAPIVKPFEKVWPSSNGHNNQLAIISLFTDVRAEISYARLTPNSKDRATKKLDRLAAGFFAGLNNTNWDGFRQKFSLDQAQSELDDLSDLLETAKLPRSDRLNREFVAKATADLVAELNARDIPEKILKLAILEVETLEKLLSQPDGASDAMIAQHIKSIVADLLIGLDPFLEKDSSLKEKIVNWGKVGTHATVFAIGLIADGSTAYDLIKGPEHTALLEAPAKQIAGSKEGE